MTFEPFPSKPEGEYPKWKIRILVGLAVIWYPVVAYFYGVGEIEGRAEIGFSAFIGLSFIALPVFGLLRSISVVADFPNRQRRRRIRLGQCIGCGYSLQGNVSGVCPECGMKV